VDVFGPRFLPGARRDGCTSGFRNLECYPGRVGAWTLRLALVAVAAAAETALSLREAVGDLQAGRAEPAERKLAVLAWQQPGSADVHFYLGVARFRLRRFPEARAALEQAVRLAPLRADAWKTLGMAHVAQRDYLAAEGPLRQACELKPQEEDACYYLGRNYYELSRFEDAISAYDKARLVESGKSWRVHNGMALSLEGLHRPEEAEQQFRLAVEAYHNPGRAAEDPRIDFGVFLFRQGRLPEATRQLQQAVTASPSSARARFELGKVLHGLGRLPEAATHLQRAIELEPQRAEAHLLLGKVYYRLGRAADAVRHTKLGQALVKPQEQ